MFYPNTTSKQFNKSVSWYYRPIKCTRKKDNHQSLRIVTHASFLWSSSLVTVTGIFTADSEIAIC